MNINIFYRKRLKEHHSIEKVYDTLIPYFDKFNLKKVELPFRSKGIIKRLFNIIYANFNQADINHITGDVNYINLLMQKRNTILTIHDVYPLYRTTGWKRFILKLFWFDIPIKNSIKVIAISEFTKNELVKHFKIAPTKIRVIHNCISPQFEASKKPFNRKQTSILHIGTKKNKNLLHLIEALSGLKVKLVIVGVLSKLQQQQLNNFNIFYENLKNVSDTQLVQLYQTSDIVSFVSTYEGFGLPIIEAQAIGRSVITSNTASMSEVAGDGAILVDPMSVSEIKNGILTLINNEELREELIEKGLENVQRFEPKKIANQYIDVYQKIIDAQ